MLIRLTVIFIIFFTIGWYADIGSLSPASIRNQKILEKLTQYEIYSPCKEQPVVWDFKIITRNITLIEKRGIKK